MLFVPEIPVIVAVKLSYMYFSIVPATATFDDVESILNDDGLVTLTTCFVPEPFSTTSANISILLPAV